MSAHRDQGIFTHGNNNTKYGSLAYRNKERRRLRSDWASLLIENWDQKTAASKEI